MHKHKKIKSRGPYCCAGSVFYIHVCSCGAQRSKCSCNQCVSQGTNDSGWFMPVCGSCGLKHAGDVACPTDRRG